MTEPVFNLPNVQEHYDQMIFEDYDFSSYLRCPGASLVPPLARRSPVSAAVPDHLVPHRPAAPALVPYGADARGDPHYPTPPPECVLVVDAGFSFTHVVPVLRGAIVTHAARRCVPATSALPLCTLCTPPHKLTPLLGRRIDVGGKLMTNYLKELVSYRHWYMMDQTAVMEYAKEQTCYVSTQWDDDWEAAK